MKTHYSPAPSHAASFSRLGELIREINIAMLTTVTGDRTLRSRPMVTQQIDLIEGAIWFFSSNESSQTGEIIHRQEVNLAYISSGNQRYVSISGQAHVIRDRAKARELWKPAAKAWFPEGLDDPTLTLLRVDVVAAEYWDSSCTKMVQLYGLAKPFAAGKPSNAPGEKVSL